MAAYAVGNELYIDQVESALKEQNLYEMVKLPIGWYSLFSVHNFFQTSDFKILYYLPCRYKLCLVFKIVYGLKTTIYQIFETFAAHFMMNFRP